MSRFFREGHYIFDDLSKLPLQIPNTNTKNKAKENLLEYQVYARKQYVFPKKSRQISLETASLTKKPSFLLFNAFAKEQCQKMFFDLDELPLKLQESRPRLTVIKNQSNSIPTPNLFESLRPSSRFTKDYSSFSSTKKLSPNTIENGLSFQRFLLNQETNQKVQLDQPNLLELDSLNKEIHQRLVIDPVFLDSFYQAFSVDYFISPKSRMYSSATSLETKTFLLFKDLLDKNWFNQTDREEELFFQKRQAESRGLNESKFNQTNSGEIKDFTRVIAESVMESAFDSFEERDLYDYLTSPIVEVLRSKLFEQYALYQRLIELYALNGTLEGPTLDLVGRDFLHPIPIPRLRYLSLWEFFKNNCRVPDADFLSSASANACIDAFFDTLTYALEHRVFSHLIKLSDDLENIMDRFCGLWIYGSHHDRRYRNRFSPAFKRDHLSLYSERHELYNDSCLLPPYPVRLAHTDDTLGHEYKKLSAPQRNTSGYLPSLDIPVPADDLRTEVVDALLCHLVEEVTNSMEFIRFTYENGRASEIEVYPKKSWQAANRTSFLSSFFKKRKNYPKGYVKKEKLVSDNASLQISKTVFSVLVKRILKDMFPMAKDFLSMTRNKVLLNYRYDTSLIKNLDFFYYYPSDYPESKFYPTDWIKSDNFIDIYLEICSHLNVFRTTEGSRNQIDRRDNLERFIEKQWKDLSGDFSLNKLPFDLSTVSDMKSGEEEEYADEIPSLLNKLPFGLSKVVDGIYGLDKSLPTEVDMKSGLDKSLPTDEQKKKKYDEKRKYVEVDADSEGEEEEYSDEEEEYGEEISSLDKSLPTDVVKRYTSILFRDGPHRSKEETRQFTPVKGKFSLIEIGITQTKPVRSYYYAQLNSLHPAKRLGQDIGANKKLKLYEFRNKLRPYGLRKVGRVVPYDVSLFEKRLSLTSLSIPYNAKEYELPFVSKIIKEKDFVRQKETKKIADLVQKIPSLDLNLLDIKKNLMAESRNVKASSFNEIFKDFIPEEKLKPAPDSRILSGYSFPDMDIRTLRSFHIENFIKKVYFQKQKKEYLSIDVELPYLTKYRYPFFDEGAESEKVEKKPFFTTPKEKSKKREAFVRRNEALNESEPLEKSGFRFLLDPVRLPKSSKTKAFVDNFLRYRRPTYHELFSVLKRRTPLTVAREFNLDTLFRKYASSGFYRTKKVARFKPPFKILVKRAIRRLKRAIKKNIESFKSFIESTGKEKKEDEDNKDKTFKRELDSVRAFKSYTGIYRERFKINGYLLPLQLVVISYSWKILLIIIKWLFVKQKTYNNSRWAKRLGLSPHYIGYRLLENLKTDMSDIAGLEANLPDVARLIGALNKASLTLRLEKVVPKGYLLAGPPGTGKTFLVRAIGGETKVPIFVEPAGGVVNRKMFLSEDDSGSRQIEDLFRKARQTTPCIVFMDEIDKFAESRQDVMKSDVDVMDFVHAFLDHFRDFDFAETSGEHFVNSGLPGNITLSKSKGGLTGRKFNIDRSVPEQGRRLDFLQVAGHDKLTILAQFLVELDGMNFRTGVIVIGATNRYKSLDPALLRPGRLERILFLNLPNKTSRLEILKLYVLGKPKDPTIPENEKKTTETKKSKRVFKSTSKDSVRDDTKSPAYKIWSAIFNEKKTTETKTSETVFKSTSEDSVRDDFVVSKPKSQSSVPYNKSPYSDISNTNTELWDYLANITVGFSVADIARAINQSSIKAISQKTVRTIETIEYGLDSITTFSREKTGLKNPTDPFFFTRFAYYQSGKAVIHTLLPLHPNPTVLKLWPRTRNNRHETSADFVPIFITSRAVLETRLIGFYAGKAGELCALSLNPQTKKQKTTNRIQENKATNRNLFVTKKMKQLQENRTQSNQSHIWDSSMGAEDLQVASNLAHSLVEKWYFYSNQMILRRGNHTVINQNILELGKPNTGPYDFLNFKTIEVMNRLSPSNIRKEERIIIYSGNPLPQFEPVRRKKTRRKIENEPNSVESISFEIVEQELAIPPYWEELISEELRRFRPSLKSWTRIYLPDNRDNHLNVQWIESDQYYDSTDHFPSIWKKAYFLPTLKNLTYSKFFEKTLKKKKISLKRTGLPTLIVQNSPFYTSKKSTKRKESRVNQGERVGKEKILDFDLTWNDLYKNDRDYIYHALVLASFNKAFSVLDENREIFDYLADYLLRFEILRQHEILQIFSDFGYFDSPNKDLTKRTETTVTESPVMGEELEKDSTIPKPPLTKGKVGRSFFHPQHCYKEETQNFNHTFEEPWGINSRRPVSRSFRYGKFSRDYFFRKEKNFFKKEKK